VQAFADETIDALPLDAIGHVAHWGGEAVTLHEIMVHKTSDLQRHAGHADILREQLDGSIGLLPGYSNIPDTTDWSTYTQRLTAIADRFDTGSSSAAADPSPLEERASAGGACGCAGYLEAPSRRVGRSPLAGGPASGLPDTASAAMGARREPPRSFRRLSRHPRAVHEA
jgi:hypothetical protein